MTGAELKLIRLRLGRTQTWCAQTVNRDRRTWIRWEAGKIKIPKHVMFYMEIKRRELDAGVTLDRLKGLSE